MADVKQVNEKETGLRWRPVAVFIVVLLAIVLGLLGDIPTLKFIPLSDKWIHFIAFFLLALTGYWVLKGSYQWRMLSGLLLIAVVTECLQIFTVYREFNLWDLSANVAGIASVVIIRLVTVHCRPE